MTGLFHIVVQRLALSFRDRFSRWFPPVVQDPEPQDPRDYLEAAVAEVLDTADRVARSLRREMNHIALGLPHREAKQAISVRLREAAALLAGPSARLRIAANPALVPVQRREWRLPPERTPPFSIFWIVLGYALILTLSRLRFPPLTAAYGVALMFLPQLVALYRWWTQEPPRNHLAVTYAGAPEPLKRLIEEEIMSALDGIEQVGRRLRYEVNALPIGVPDEPLHRELSEHLAEAGATLSAATDRFEELTGRRSRASGAARATAGFAQPLGEARHFGESEIRAVLTDLELIQQRLGVELATLASPSRPQAAPEAVRRLADLESRLTGARARLAAVVGDRRQPSPSRHPAAALFLETVQGLAEGAIIRALGELESAARRLRRELTMSDAGLANAGEREGIAETLAACGRDLVAARARLNDLTGRS